MEPETSVLGMAAIRERKGISLREISDRTKIGVRALEAIERGEFQKLPGGIYTTSYLRQYARAIDFDENELVAYYKRQMNGGKPPVRPLGPQSETRSVLPGMKPASSTY